MKIKNFNDKNIIRKCIAIQYVYGKYNIENCNGTEIKKGGMLQIQCEIIIHLQGL